MTHNFSIYFLILYSFIFSNPQIKKIEGSYSITTMIKCELTKKTENVSYYISVKKNVAIVSMSTKHTIDYYCEGEYKLIKFKNFYHAKGICSDESDESDFYIKIENGKTFIKSKRFVNKNWQELTKE